MYFGDLNFPSATILKNATEGLSTNSKTELTNSPSTLSSVELSTKPKTVLNDCLGEISYAPVFTPTLEEFSNPVKYLRSIEKKVESYGLCKIQIPHYYRSHVNEFPTKLRNFHFTVREQKLREHIWEAFSLSADIIYEHEKAFELGQFRSYVKEAGEKLLKDSHRLPPTIVESEFWKWRNSAESKDVYILYGNDVEGTACDPENCLNIGSTPWNLQELGRASWSLLRHAPMDYPGVTTPMLYIGSLFSTFFWHVEDHWMHSINFSHYGAVKTWYGVPATHAEAFEKVVFEKVYKKAIHGLKRKHTDEDFIHKSAMKQLLAKNTLFHPKLLVEAGVPVYKVDQHPGDFVVTFPRSYHSGFSHGFNVGEAVNFALPEWFSLGQRCLQRYCFLQLPQILPHQMLTVKEAAAVFDRLRSPPGKRPSRIDRCTIDHFCEFVEEHEMLRKSILEERKLVEVHLDLPLRNHICFLCYRHVIGCFVRHRESNVSRCMHCSSHALHITKEDWDLAVPKVMKVIEYLYHQFTIHYPSSSHIHPLHFEVPRRPRSIKTRMTGKKRKTHFHFIDDCYLDGVENSNCKRSLAEEEDSNSREEKLTPLDQASLTILQQEWISMPNGVDYPRTILEDQNSQLYVLGDELLRAIGAPIVRSLDVDHILLEFQKHMGQSWSLLKRPCVLAELTMIATVLDGFQLKRVLKAVNEKHRKLIKRFLKGCQINLGQQREDQCL